jgi:hypothetical protein
MMTRELVGAAWRCARARLDFHDAVQSSGQPDGSSLWEGVIGELGVLYSFAHRPDATNTEAALAFGKNGALYGTTYCGGRPRMAAQCSNSLGRLPWAVLDRNDFV